MANPVIRHPGNNFKITHGCLVVQGTYIAPCKAQERGKRSSSWKPFEAQPCG